MLLYGRGWSRSHCRLPLPAIENGRFGPAAADLASPLLHQHNGMRGSNVREGLTRGAGARFGRNGHGVCGVPSLTSEPPNRADILVMIRRHHHDLHPRGASGSQGGQPIGSAGRALSTRGSHHSGFPLWVAVSTGIIPFGIAEVSAAASWSAIPRPCLLRTIHSARFLSSASSGATSVVRR